MPLIEPFIADCAEERAILIRRIKMLEAGELTTHSGRFDMSNETLASDKAMLAEMTYDLSELAQMAFADRKGLAG